LFPVDAEAFVLPREDFTAQEASRYPRLVGIDKAPLAGDGTRWGDDRVLGAVEIGAALADQWEKLGLKSIVAERLLETGVRETPRFGLLTRGGTRIPWGRAPSGDAPGEIPIKDKLAKLENYLANHGSLESQPGGVGLDLSRPDSAEGSGVPAPLVPLR